ncbi:hypothetical protein BDR06DRAFT_239256 [Suillus hirtellus]|nr:hypothetical protein BDR06DRAFT_239256 [Suillus hirtellus]
MYDVMTLCLFPMYMSDRSEWIIWTISKIIIIGLPVYITLPFLEWILLALSRNQGKVSTISAKAIELAHGKFTNDFTAFQQYALTAAIVSYISFQIPASDLESLR